MCTPQADYRRPAAFKELLESLAERRVDVHLA